MIKALGRKPMDEQEKLFIFRLVTRSDNNGKGNVFGREVLFIGVTGYIASRICAKTRRIQAPALHLFFERCGVYLAWETGAGKTNGVINAMVGTNLRPVL